MAKLLLLFACIIVANVILSNAQQNASSNETNQSLLLSAVQIHLQTSANNITNGMRNANTILPAAVVTATTTQVPQSASASPRAFINENIKHENGSIHHDYNANNRNAVLYEEIQTLMNPISDVNEKHIHDATRSTATVMMSTKFEEFTLAPQMLTNSDHVTSISIDDIEPVNNIDTRNIYKIIKQKSAKIMPPKRHIAETIIVPFKLDSQPQNNFHHYDAKRKFEGADQHHLNIFQIITDLYDQSQWKIDAITKRVNEFCLADMAMYLMALGKGEPWALKGKRVSV